MIGSEHITRAVQTLKQYAQARLNDCEKGLESPEISALLVEKYAWGMHEGLLAVDRDCDTSSIIAEADSLCLGIDPSHAENRKLRYTKFAKLDLSAAR